MIMPKKIIALSIIAAAAFAATISLAADETEKTIPVPSDAYPIPYPIPSPTTVKTPSPTPIKPYDSAVQPPDLYKPVPIPAAPVRNNESPAVKKCGVNTYGVSNECGAGAFKNMYFQCYDGYEEKQGGESSCKSSEAWSEYAREICANRCSIVRMPQPVPESKPVPTITPTQPTALAKPIAICYIPDKLTKDYNQLLIDFRKAESEGNKEIAETITKKITALKLEIERAQKECFANASQTGTIQHPTEEPRPLAPVAINRCLEVSQWENKIAYYRKLAGLNDAELKEQTGFSREEVEKILSDLPNGLVKIKAGCESQKTAGTQTAETVRQFVAEPVKPVAVESGKEINVYYKTKIERITARNESVETQVENLKSLKTEINELIEKLLKGRKEIEVSELNNVVSEIKVSQGEIKADDIAIKTTDKKIFVNVGNASVSVAPTSRQVLIQDKNLEVSASEVSIKDNALRVGASEVKLAASQVAKNLGVEPQSAELKEENARAVYKLKVAEPRKLFGLVPIRITKTMTADAESSDLLNEKLPWYSFLTTR
jgi:hypothetical protein